MIHAPRPLQGGRWLFKRVFGGRTACSRVPLGFSRSFPQLLQLPTFPAPNPSQPDFGREQNPKCPLILPSIASNGKEKTRGHKRRPVTHTLPWAGDVAGIPAALRVPLGLHLAPHPTSAQLRRTPSPARGS